MRYRRKAVKVRPTGPRLRDRLADAVSIAWPPFLRWVLPALALVVLCALGLYYARSYIARSPRYRVVAPTVSLPSPPPLWWEKSFEDEINRSCAFANGESIFDPSLLERIGQAYLRCPWVKSVHWVEKRYPNRVCANLELRLPAAAVAVRTTQGVAYCLVAEDGVRLPKVYAGWPPRGLSAPVIFGTAAAVPDPGQPWPEESVADAIRIVRLLECSNIVRRALRVSAVDVSNYGGRRDPGRSEFVLLTDNNCVVEWGRAPDTDRPGELPVQEKIAKLERFLNEGNPTANRTLDLRFAGRVVVITRSTTGNGHNG